MMINLWRLLNQSQEQLLALATSANLYRTISFIVEEHKKLFCKNTSIKTAFMRLSSDRKSIVKLRGEIAIAKKPSLKTQFQLMDTRQFFRIYTHVQVHLVYIHRERERESSSI